MSIVDVSVRGENELICVDEYCDIDYDDDDDDDDGWIMDSKFNESSQ